MKMQSGRCMKRTEGNSWKNMDFIAMRFPIMHGRKKSDRHNLGIGAELEYLGIGLEPRSFISNTRYHLCTDMISAI